MPSETNDPNGREPQFFTIAIIEPAGMKHYIALAAADDMRQGHPITFRPEPDNEHDHLAVELLWHPDGHGGTKIGYVPRPLNQAIRSLLHEGYNLRAAVAVDGAARIRIEMAR